MGVNLNDYDIYHNHTGGIRIKIPRRIFLALVIVLSKIDGHVALRDEIYDKLKIFLQTMEDENVYGACPGLFMHEPTVPDLEDILWACSSEKLIADIIQTSLDWGEPELTDWVQELKRGEHKF